MQTIIKTSDVLSSTALKTTPIHVSFDPVLIEPFLDIAELRRLVQTDILGDCEDDARAFYYAIRDDRDASTGLFTNAHYQKLFDDYLNKYLCLSVVVEALPHIAQQVGTGGIFEAQTQFLDNAGEKGADNLQDKYLRMLGVLRKEIQYYLKENYTLFPLYKNTLLDKYYNDCRTGDDMEDERYIKPKTNNFGIIIY